MTVAAAGSALTPAERRRLITRGLLRALAGTVVLVALYFLYRSIASTACRWS